MNTPRALLVAYLAIVAAATSVAEGTDGDLAGNVVSYVQLDLLADQKAFLSDSGLGEMQKLSTTLPSFYRDVLFERYAANPWSAVSLNLVTGGLGSILMGDGLFGTINQAGMTAVVGITIAGIILGPPANDALYLAAEIGAVGFTVTGIVAPFLYASRHNKRLEQALGYE